MIFACCHPALDSDKQIALTLRTVGGLTTAEIARAFLVAEPTMAQRLVRAKSKVRDAGIPFKVPEEHDLVDRISEVLSVVYLIFGEGYFSTSGDALVRDDLAGKAIELGELLANLMPDESEVHALNALMLFQDSRRKARTDSDGDLVVLRKQDRSLWDREMIERGLSALRKARNTAEPGVYLLQAEIAAHHTVDSVDTDWRAIVGLYDMLVARYPSPVARLNRAVAIGQADGSEAALAVVDSLQADLDGYHAFHSTKAHFLAEVGRTADSAAAYRRALGLIGNDPGRRYLESRLQDLDY
jgi:RNA polymerase sigma-70 factor (ECF subfamily)